MIKSNFYSFNSTDILIQDLIAKELQRQQDHIELIASENIVSKDILYAQGSILTNKYAEGYPNKRYYGGCEVVDEIENLAISRAKSLFNANFANVQPHSGTSANTAVYFALLQPHDKILGMSLDSGGHLTHGAKISISGKWLQSVAYDVNKTDYLIDYNQIEEIAQKEKPKLIIAGGSSYSRFIDFKIIANIAKSINAYFMVDMAHFSGIVAANLYPQNPLDYADIVTSTTHKTLRGPRGGLILTNNEEIHKKINSAVFPGTQGGPLMHVIAAKATCFLEASTQDFKDYIKQVLLNTKTMADYFQNSGYNVVSKGTDTHLFCLDISSLNTTGKFIEEELDKMNITCNKNAIPFDTKNRIQTSGIRLGTAAVTSRGLRETEIVFLSQLINQILQDIKNNTLTEKNKKEYKEEVIALCSKYPIY